jgi:hypothetical protein
MRRPRLTRAAGRRQARIAAEGTAEQAKQLEAMKRALAEQEATIRELRSTVDSESLARKRGGQGVGTGVTPGNMATNAAAAAGASATQINSTAQQGVQAQQAPSDAPPQAVAPQQQGQAAQGASRRVRRGSEEPVGRPPERDTRPPEIAPIFDQPGVLTPPARSSSSRASSTATRRATAWRWSATR